MALSITMCLVAQEAIAKDNDPEKVRIILAGLFTFHPFQDKKINLNATKNVYVHDCSCTRPVSASAYTMKHDLLKL